MPRKNSGILKTLRNVDDICKITTGRRLNEILATAIDAFGEDILNKVASASETENIEDIARRMPYAVLGVNPSAPDFIVKAAYKQYMKECHPDTDKSDEDKAKKINNAYDAICKERGIPK